MSNKKNSGGKKKNRGKKIPTRSSNFQRGKATSLSRKDRKKIAAERAKGDPPSRYENLSKTPKKS